MRSTQEIIKSFRKRDYWIVENSQYAEVSFRLRKCGRIINDLAGGRECSLLDVGCGPGALRTVLAPNIRYYGIDIAIHERAPHFRELDLANDEISYDGMRFDFVTAFGFFEYMGHVQNKKLQEIKACLKPGGKFLMTYINFGHFRRQIWPNYNNVQPIDQMLKNVEDAFRVEKLFPASHHWRQKQPGKNAIPVVQMHVNFNIPLLSPLLAVEYLFVCSAR